MRPLWNARRPLWPGSLEPHAVPSIAFACLLVAGLVFLACTFRPVVDGDGVNYFAYLHSLVLDHDLDFANEYGAAQDAGLALNETLVGTRTATGLLANFQPPGSALLALPFYLGALALRPGGEPQFGPPFVTAFAVASLFYGLLAVGLAARLAGSADGSPVRGAAAACAAGLTTPFVFYLAYEPSYAHTFSAFAASAFVLLWWRGRGEQSALSWSFLGLLGGLLGTVRIQDAALAAVALVDVPRTRWRALAFAPGFVLGFLPQLLAARTLFGTWLPDRPPEYALQPWPGHYLDVLLSSHNGLLPWSPVFAAAAVGIALLPDRRLGLAALIAAAGQVAIVGSTPDWWGGHSFGMRRLVNLLPFVSVGLAELARRLPAAAAAAAGAALAAWNLLSMVNFLYVLRVDRDPGYLGLLAGQVHAVPFLPRPFAQGAVVRDLALWPLLHQPFRPLAGLALLVLEAACLLVALLVARVGVRRGPRSMDRTGGADLGMDVTGRSPEEAPEIRPRPGL